MKYYAVAEIEVTDPTWVRDYVADVTAIVERRGGRYLAHIAGREDRGAARAAADLLDHRVALQRGGRGVLRVRPVSAYRESRVRGARNEFVGVAGEDEVGAARIDG